MLIAEDDPDIRTVMKLVFSRAAYRVVAAADGLTTLDLARRWTPDLVTLDVSMPGMTGLEVCRTLRADLATAGIGVLIVSAWSLPSHVDAGRDAGADDYLIKPFRHRELLRRAEALVSRGHQSTHHPARLG